ncbi:DUF4236 domain-containing protein [Nocardia sp. CA2R105]|nr:DUF4236 domain-containing protein [Nocardia coffeae]
MGFYLGKSLRAGPFRFNLSTSGIGVSAGVPGFRVGTGPRGNYVSVGAGGIRYRTAIGPTASRSRSGASLSRTDRPAGFSSPAPYAPMTDLTGASAESLVSTGGDDLVQQLNDAARRWNWALILTIALVVFVTTAFPFGLVAVVVLPAVWWLWQWDQGRRNVVVFYDVTDDPAAWYDTVVTNAQTWAQSHMLWRIEASRQLTGTHQRKVNALAGSLINRSPLGLQFEKPKHLVTNIVVPTFVCGRDALYLLPDRILVRTKRTFSDVTYDRLNVDWSVSRFIESGRVPRDGRQVDTTWQYANIGGGPDRRFKNNRQIPVMAYDRLTLSSGEGLSWIIDSSRPDASKQLAAVLRRSPALEATASPHAGLPERTVQDPHGALATPPAEVQPEPTPVEPQRIQPIALEMRGVEKNPATSARQLPAEVRYRKAADAGDIAAINSLGDMLEQDDPVQAEHWYRKAAHAREISAMFLRGYELRESDPVQAVAWYRRAADAGDTNAMSSLGYLFKERGDLVQAEHWWRRAVDAGDTDVLFSLGLLFAQRGDLVQAEHWYRRAADAGDTDVLSSLGDLFELLGDPVQPVAWYRKAADVGDFSAMFSLGDLFEERGDLVQAEHWYQKSAHVREISAMVQRGYELREIDPVQAVAWYRRAADAGDTDVLGRLGYLFEKRGDLVQAEHWWRQAADTGDTNAMNRLGLMFEERGDLVQAEHWCRRAVDAGDTDAMSSLGRLFERLGDPVQAVAWYRKAADAGDTDAMTSLGDLLEQADPVQAEHWWRQATET